MLLFATVSVPSRMLLIALPLRRHQFPEMVNSETATAPPTWLSIAPPVDLLAQRRFALERALR